MLSSHLRVGLPSDLFPSGFHIRILYTPLLSPIRAACPTHLILAKIRQCKTRLDVNAWRSAMWPVQGLAACCRWRCVYHSTKAGTCFASEQRSATFNVKGTVYCAKGIRFKCTAACNTDKLKPTRTKSPAHNEPRTKRPMRKFNSTVASS